MNGASAAPPASHRADNEISDWFAVGFCEAQKLDDIHPPFTRLGLRHVALGPAELRGGLPLAQAGGLPRGNQPPSKLPVVLRPPRTRTPSS